MRKSILLLTAVALLAFVNYGIAQREQLLEQGQVVLLELAPVDPRSLMQGDYMALRFAAAAAVLEKADSEKLSGGYLVLGLDANRVAAFRRLDDGAALAPDEVRMRYRKRDKQIKFATNAYFFEEGSAKLYEGARYGEFRVAPDGEALLTGLRDAKLVSLGSPRER